MGLNSVCSRNQAAIQVVSTRSTEPCLSYILLRKQCLESWLDSEQEVVENAQPVCLQLLVQQALCGHHVIDMNKAIVTLSAVADGSTRTTENVWHSSTHVITQLSPSRIPSRSAICMAMDSFRP